LDQVEEGGPLDPPDHSQITAFLGLVSLAAIAWWFNIGAAGLFDDTEPLFVEASRQMLLVRDFLTPQVKYILHV
jgi:4-amino-4-deoxy-L-arabinose transferase-like glycosyltransferase